MGKAQRKEMAAEAVSYEEQRRRQVEANKRKLEELQLHHLSAAVREAAAKPVGPGCLANGLAVPRLAPFTLFAGMELVAEVA